MRLVLGKMGVWHLPTAIIGTSPMAQEVVPVLGQQLALGLKVRWVVPETPENHLSNAFAGLIAADRAAGPAGAGADGGGMPPGHPGAGRPHQRQSTTT